MGCCSSKNMEDDKMIVHNNNNNASAGVTSSITPLVFTTTHHAPPYQPPKIAADSPPPPPPPQQKQNRPVQSPVPANAILGRAYEDVTQRYALGKELGKGQFGITYLCTEKATGRSFACKSILKRKLASRDDREDVRREIQIMQHLSGQPNVVEIVGAYEDRFSVHLVMELCAGLELFDRIIARGQYSERRAVEVFRAVANFVHICHFMGVIHRDLKPENFLFASKDEDAMLKAADFGLSVFIEEGL